MVISGINSVEKKLKMKEIRKIIRSIRSIQGRDRIRPRTEMKMIGFE